MFRLSTIALLGTVPVFGAELSFNRDVRPILSEYCYQCHGFDKNNRKADLRLDNLAGATANLDGNHAIVPGSPETSEAIQRMLSSDPEEVMPPPKTKKKVKPEHVTILKEWIKQGAKYEGHWAFTPPVRPAVPQPAQPGVNAVDAFIRARLDREGLKPAPAADKATLLRRVTYDLTGLPPTPAEIDAFLADASPDAYEKVVDRLLRSPRYGEKMAVHWLDLSRYADTHGYHLDSGRDMWPWRDWVIEAFNRNQPFDEFVRWQLAGDLLPEKLPQQKLATGFVRNNMINFEGGAIAEEYLNAYMVDRVSTVGSVFLGLSINCAQCHDHKYDPVSTREFYQLYAYFNAAPESGLDGSKGNAAPVMRMPTAEQEQKIEAAKKFVTETGKAVTTAREAAVPQQAEWEKSLATSRASAWAVLTPTDAQTASGAQFAALGDGSLLAKGVKSGPDEYTFTLKLPKPGIAALQLEALTHESLVGQGPGRAANGNFVLTDVRVEDARDGKAIAIARAGADYEQKGFPASAAIDGDAKSGWAVDGNEKHETRTAWFVFAEPVNAPVLRVKLAFRGGFAGHSIGRTRFSVSHDARAAAGAGIPVAVTQAIAIPLAKRTPAQVQTVTDYFLKDHVPALRDLTAKWEEAKKAEAAAEKSVSTVMVMEQMDRPRDTFIRVRGDYATHGDKVEPGIPAALGSLPADAPKDRRSLATWLTDRKNPLLARVTVNRLWRNLFGTGIVKTVNDFGLQGEWPTNPELLDWLAVEFMDRGWDVKGFMRLLVTSAAYRQSAHVSPEAFARDPENRLLARGPRFRLSAEEIRDTALAVSGLLNPRIGGASVYPYQPAGLWEELSSRGDSKNWTAQFFVQSHGEDLYRRSMYTFIKRTCPPPQMQTFDAPDREICTAQRERTNTPLQALVTLNDPTYLEASRILAEKMVAQAAVTPAERVKFAFRLATGRMPSDREVALLTDLFAKEHARYASQPAVAAKLLAVGEAPHNATLDAADLAAWTIVASTILNLDETLTRG